MMPPLEECCKSPWAPDGVSSAQGDLQHPSSGVISAYGDLKYPSSGVTSVLSGF